MANTTKNPNNGATNPTNLKVEKSKQEFLGRVRHRHTPHPPPSSLKGLDMPARLEPCSLVGRGIKLMDDVPMSLLTDNFMGMNLDLSSMPGAFLEDDDVLNPRLLEYNEIDQRDMFMLMNVKDDSIKYLGSNGLMTRKDPSTASWLRRTQYISSEPINVKSEKSKFVDFVDKALLRQQPENKVESILESFEAANDPIRRENLTHPTKPNVKAESFIEVFPKFDTWSEVYTMCTFDGDPYDGVEFEESLNDPEIKKERLDKSILKPVDHANEPFLSYYLPAKEEVDRLRTGTLFEHEEESYEYTWIRDYSFEAGSVSKNNSILLFFNKDDLGEGGEYQEREQKDREDYDEKIARYHLLERRLLLRKKRRQPYQHSKVPDDYDIPKSIRILYTGETVENIDNKRRKYEHIGLEEDEIEEHLTRLQAE
ncbi:8596_t:CDS:2 [Ambispora leptoticha]|uniref:8596_t:CDS:1 n=1 Tax=Ambispora leptoticha TaxID=144679 RepID=A0A9N9CVE6_9GLOM|nr:8596_t:CDS:2 [Ambispora leptoticha]